MEGNCNIPFSVRCPLFLFGARTSLTWSHSLIPPRCCSRRLRGSPLRWTHQRAGRRKQTFPKGPTFPKGCVAHGSLPHRACFRGFWGARAHSSAGLEEEPHANPALELQHFRSETLTDICVPIGALNPALTSPTEPTGSSRLCRWKRSHVLLGPATGVIAPHSTPPTPTFFEAQRASRLSDWKRVSVWIQETTTTACRFRVSCGLRLVRVSSLQTGKADNFTSLNLLFRHFRQGSRTLRAAAIEKERMIPKQGRSAAGRRDGCREAPRHGIGSRSGLLVSSLASWLAPVLPFRPVWLYCSDGCERPALLRQCLHGCLPSVARFPIDQISTRCLPRLTTRKWPDPVVAHSC